jgi:hypothetical protein
MDLRGAALSFDIKRLNPLFLADPFRSTARCASTTRCIACRTARACSHAGFAMLFSIPP